MEEGRAGAPAGSAVQRAKHAGSKRKVSGPIGLAACLLVVSLFVENGAQAGDIAYGEYLAQECLVCHQNDGSYRGIPVIVGLDAESFVEAMTEYKFYDRENEVMRGVARTLDFDQIDALAAYFSSLEPVATAEGGAEQ